MKKRLVMATAAVLAAALFAGSTMAAEPKKNAYEEETKIGYLAVAIGDSVSAAWIKGIEKYLSSFSTISVDTYDGQASVDTQVQIMDEMIEQQYDAILLQAVDMAGLGASVEKAEEAGIPVITMNLDADATHAGLVAMVDVEAGQLIAKAIGDALGGEGSVVIISATPGATKGQYMDQGFKGELEANYPGIEILDEQTGEWLTENANTVMNDFLTKYPDVKAVFCHNDAMAEGAAAAIEAAGKTGEIAVWGADGETKMLEYIEQGLCTGTVYTNCTEQGALAAQLAIYCINTGITGADLSATPTIKMSPVVVTADNVATITPDIRW